MPLHTRTHRSRAHWSTQLSRKVRPLLSVDARAASRTERARCGCGGALCARPRPLGSGSARLRTRHAQKSSDASSDVSERTSQSSRHIATTSRSGVRSGGPRGTGSRGGVAGAAPLAGAELVDAPQLRGAEEVTLDDDDQPHRLLGDGVGVAHCGGGGGSDMALADAQNSATVVEHWVLLLARRGRGARAAAAPRRGPRASAPPKLRRAC